VIGRCKLPLEKGLDGSPLFRSEDVRPQASKPHITIIGKRLNTFSSHSNDCRVCAPLQGAKNLAKVESRLKKRAAGATETKPNEAEIKGKLVEFLWWMRKQGYAESTILSRGSRLRRLVKLGANLFDPESVKEVIAKQKNWSLVRKEAMVWTYDLWAKWFGIEWEKPIYKPARKLPFIPLEREIDDLIAGCNSWVATFLQIAKETGARAGEIYNLTWFDIDFENRTISIAAEKGSNPRMFKMSNKLVAMLRGLPREHERIFKHYEKLNYLRRSFDRYRKRTAHKLGNPRILKITFHTLRHWKATMEYHRTKDILYVMKILGHRSIKNTLIYTQLIPNDVEEHYISKVAKTINEARLLVEAGFQYVCDIEGVKLFRKRK
jgi:integrase